jgi:hypothetical protein
MRIPTAIIVNDDNRELEELANQLYPLLRIYRRNSLEGEKLYGIREGVLYYDDRGDKQMLHQDVYIDTVKQIQNRLATISTPAKSLLDSYLKQRGKIE